VNEIEVSEDKAYIRIGVGNRWGAVNHVLDPLGVATAGGRISGVGVGGFTSGGKTPYPDVKYLLIVTTKGGMSFYSPRLGLVCDAVLNFEARLSLYSRFR
jgi:FAD/FMN-containing dehydrogenase